MSIEANKKLVLELLENRAAGNIDAFLDALADDFTLWMQGNLPISGTRSKREVAEMITQLNPTFDGRMHMTIKGVTAEADRVAVEAESYATLKNGQIYRNTYHYLFVVRDGKVQSTREYLDTLHTRDVLLS